ncbi:MAG TPA: ankyrin repeat domain-containing protein [Lacunisphaera sp.]|jgi:hypothetical protein
MRSFSLRSWRAFSIVSLSFSWWLLSSVTGCTNNLNRAIYREHPDLVQKFLAEGADVNQANDNGGTPLIYAAQYSDLTLIKTLVERGAMVNATDRDGNSALSYVAAGKIYRNDAAVFLLSHGADVNVVNHEGRTPLHLAMARSGESANDAKQLELVTVLLSAGADPMLKTKKGELALHLAAAADQSDAVMEKLLSATKDPHDLDFTGYSAFSKAARVGAHRTALFLISHSFAPQEFVPAATAATGPYATIDVAREINARAWEAVGDRAFHAGDKAGALAAYQTSATSYDSALADCRRVTGIYENLLKEAKAARKHRIMGTVAANVVGGGLAATTGVGFVAVPKRVKDNHIDEYAEALARNQAELTAITRDQANLAAKLHDLEAALKSEPAVASVPVVAVMPATMLSSTQPTQ